MFLKAKKKTVKVKSNAGSMVQKTGKLKTSASVILNARENRLNIYCLATKQNKNQRITNNLRTAIYSAKQA